MHIYLSHMQYNAKQMKLAHIHKSRSINKVSETKYFVTDPRQESTKYSSPFTAIILYRPLKYEKMVKSNLDIHLSFTSHVRPSTSCISTYKSRSYPSKKSSKKPTTHYRRRPLQAYGGGMLMAKHAYYGYLCM